MRSLFFYNTIELIFPNPQGYPSDSPVTINVVTLHVIPFLYEDVANLAHAGGLRLCSPRLPA